MRRDKFREQNRFSVMSDCFSVLLSKLVSAHQQSQIIFLSTQIMPITIDFNVSLNQTNLVFERSLFKAV